LVTNGRRLREDRVRAAHERSECFDLSRRRFGLCHSGRGMCDVGPRLPGRRVVGGPIDHSHELGRQLTAARTNPIAALVRRHDRLDPFVRGLEAQAFGHRAVGGDQPLDHVIHAHLTETRRRQRATQLPR
jgi:hypothetical protein